MIRRAPLLVSILGIVSLAMSLLYVAAVFASFHPRGAEVSKVMVGEHAGEFGYAIVLVFIPYLLLLVYLSLRVRLGHWLVEKGAPQEALEYVEGKMNPSFSRSRTEANSHRAAAVRARLRLGETEEASLVFGRSWSPSGRGRIGREAVLWLVQAALRVDDLVTANKTLSKIDLKGRSATAGSLHAVRAIVRAREGDEEAWSQSLESARWCRTPGHLVAWAFAVGVARFEIAARAAEALEEVARHAERLDEEVPGRRAERLLVVAKLRELEGDRMGAEEAREAAGVVADPDPRSRRLSLDKGDRG